MSTFLSNNTLSINNNCSVCSTCAKNKLGHLELIIGPMFSGKSSEIIRRIKLFQKINKKVIVIKPIIDKRYIDDKITSHNYESVECIVMEKLSEISENHIATYDTVVIDEGQFFPDLYEVVTTLLYKYPIDIIVAGLDGDFERKPIGKILNLIPEADKCEKLVSMCNICKDGTTAPFSLRVVESKDKILVGGSDMYIPVCRKHHKEFCS